MKACDEKLKSCLIKAMEQEEAELKEELKRSEPHVFSAEYKEAIENAMRVRTRKRSRCCVYRYVAAVAAVILLTCGILFVGSENLNASNMRIDILEWLEDFFTLRNHSDVAKENEVIFDESQIGYIPEGFEKVANEERHMRVRYDYANTSDKFLSVHVAKDNSYMQIHNEEVYNDIQINEAGFEYMLLKANDNKQITLIWQDEDGVSYCVEGNLDAEELTKIMNGITYKEDDNE